MFSYQVVEFDESMGRIWMGAHIRRRRVIRAMTFWPALSFGEGQTSHFLNSSRCNRLQMELPMMLLRVFFQHTIPRFSTTTQIPLRLVAIMATRLTLSSDNSTKIHTTNHFMLADFCQRLIRCSFALDQQLALSASMSLSPR